MFALYLVKTTTNLTAYSTVSSVSNMKSPHNSQILTSDNYQVMLTVIHKKAVHIIKANV